MKSLRSAFLTLLLLSPFVAAPAHAKDMQGRLGLGYNSEWANTKVLNQWVPGVSLKYGLTKDLATELIIGIATTSPSNSVTGVKFFKNVFYETSLNFYFFVGAALLAGGGSTGSQFLGGFGAEFFIPGIESLGFAVETGGSLDNLGGSFALKSMGVSFLNAGIHFYF
jgi:hypothetical protein